jgi:hypothetical protein
MEVTAITNYFQPMEKQKHSKKLRKWKDTDSRSNSGKELDKL